jgi:16S rRNA processing protein RimM
LARVLKTQGRRGEVAVEPHTNVPDRFSLGMKLSALAEDGSRRELEVEEAWPHKGLLVLKFVGIDSISEAEPLAGCELQIPQAERASLEEGWSYISDLVGCAVFDGDREVGAVSDVQLGAGEAPLLMVKSGAEAYEIPYAEAYLKRVDLAQRRIEMQLPEGLLDVNAPLTAEEKLAQRKSKA